jgi:formylglycine-generating enzyme required for sulfatase activity
MRKAIVSLGFVIIVILCVCMVGCKSEAPEPVDALDDPIVEDTGGVPAGMVLIPAGKFQMGSDNPDGEMDEKPVHTVYVDAFYMDKYQVTYAQYKKFVDANPEWQKASWWKSKEGIEKKYHDGEYLKDWDRNNYPEGKDNHPVTYVSWYAAMAYAKWVGKRLPTEAEWEKAARGGFEGLEYPWGNTINPSNASYPPHGGFDSPVGLYPANEYGLYDMIGNVWEWCLDAHDPNFYENSPYKNPIGGADSIAQVIDNFTYIRNARIMRGGGCCNNPLHLRVAVRDRHPATCSHEFNGFRCAKSVVLN